MLTLKVEKVYYNEKVNDKNVVSKFYSVVAKDEKGNEYRLFLSDLDMQFAKTRSDYFRGAYYDSNK